LLDSHIMQIRDANPADADSIAAMHTENWRAGYRGHMQDAYLDGAIFEERRQAWHARMQAPPPTQHVILAVDAGELVGFSSMLGRDDAQWGNMLDNLHVSGRHKGRGIGEQLLRATAARLEQHYPGIGMYLWVLEANHGARRFYERLGGANTESDAWSPPDGSTLPCLRYVWPDLAALIA
jgi:ribosomal protein S18 acetylase RimI-like enzyme